jgi:hypothetical protein
MNKRFVLTASLALCLMTIAIQADDVEYPIFTTYACNVTQETNATQQIDTYIAEHPLYRDKLILEMNRRLEICKLYVERGSVKIPIGELEIENLFVLPMVWAADFNADGQVDFAVVRSYMGSGINAWLSEIIVCLSSQSTYTLKKFDDWNNSERSFVDINHDGKAEYLQKTVIIIDEDESHGKDMPLSPPNILELHSSK